MFDEDPKLCNEACLSLRKDIGDHINCDALVMESMEMVKEVELSNLWGVGLVTFRFDDVQYSSNKVLTCSINKEVERRFGRKLSWQSVIERRHWKAFLTCWIEALLFTSSKPRSLRFRNEEEGFNVMFKITCKHAQEFHLAILFQGGFGNKDMFM